MNYNNSVRNNQAFSKEYLNIAHMLGGSTPAMFLPEHVSGYTPLRLNMINFVLRCLNIHKIAFPSQSTIAKAVGCNREAVNVAFKFFEEQSIFIIKSGKKRYRTNIYSLGAVLCNPQVRWALRYVCTGLTRVYHRIAMDLKSLVKKAIVEPKRTLLYKINVFKKNNTSISSYREKRLYSTPFLTKENWLNKQKALWSDWSIRESDLHYQREERESMYKSWNKPKKEVEDPKPSLNIGKIHSIVMHERLEMCSNETNLERRIAMFERLRDQVERASIPYIDFLIRKTKAKINALQD